VIFLRRGITSHNHFEIWRTFFCPKEYCIFFILKF
jgi:hypothetical protein